MTANFTRSEDVFVFFAELLAEDAEKDLLLKKTKILLNFEA